MKRMKTMALMLALVLALSAFAGCSNEEKPTPSTSTGAETQPVTVTDPVETEAPDEPGDDYEEGTSSTDEIVNTTPADKVILVVSFGTSFNQSRNLTIGGLETAIAKAYPDYQVRRAFTSQIIIDKLAERDGLRIDNVQEAMDRLVLDKVKEVVIQPTHIMEGFEYEDVMAEVMPYADKFESFKVGRSLLSAEEDYAAVADIIVAATEDYRADDTAIVFMGHGTEHEASATYGKLQGVLDDKGYKDYIIGTVEHGIEIDQVVAMLSEMDVKNVVLRPLMVVSGDHANNDMAGGEEDSWDYILEQEGYKVTSVLEGLGQVPAIQDRYIEHVQETMDSENLSKASAATAAGASAARIKDGTYQIEVSSSTSMFKIVDCRLTVDGAAMTAVVTLSGQGFSKLYLGTGEEAAADSEENFYTFTDDGSRHSFVLPVEALDRELELSGLSARKETWYDHTVVFKSDNIPAEDFLPVKIDLAMSGGTGRASIDSPATLLYRDGRNFAELVWSSPNYTYMIVNGEKYLPTNSEGNSSFEIPVELDRQLSVLACTVAMSEPKEIAYELNFDSSSIR